VSHETVVTSGGHISGHNCFMVYTYTLSLTNHEGAVAECKYSGTLSLTSALDGGGWSTLPLGLFTPRNDRELRIVYEGGWTPGPVWTSAENSALRDSIPGPSSP
jgi:hypothetical protein